MLKTRALAWIAVVSMIAAFLVLGDAPKSEAADPCGTGSNPIVCENSKTGTPRAVWDIGTTAGDDDIQGFSTTVSVKPGGTIGFKISAPQASAYTITIYRTGWYGGDGARQIATVTPSAKLPQTQPSCVYDSSLEETDCGNWALSASWAVPADAVSGVYVADLYRADRDDKSQITFVVTDPGSHSDVLVKTSDATWQAYNTYGGADFYQGGGPGRAYAISYNRPIVTRGSQYSGAGGRDFYFNAEYPLVEFLEQNGYDVSYTTDVDVSTAPASLLEQHSVVVSAGHDEYWTGPERTNFEAARDAGVNLQFLSGNEAYWHVRLTPSIDGSNTANRTITSYKETWSNAKIDPSSTWTGTWRDPRFASQANGAGLPEESLTGTMYMNNATDSPVTVTSAQGKGALWANTGLSSMSGASTALAQHTVGYESDEDVDDGFRQSGLLYLSTTTATTAQELQDFGSVVATGTTTHHMTLYRAASGALVFGAGSIQWTWGLNANHDGNDKPAADARMQQFEVNLLAMAGVQPQTLMGGLVAGAGHTDTTPPTAVVTAPAAGASVANGSSVTLAGTASDVGGIVAAVEVSVDGGTTWHLATGTTSWSYTFVQHGIGAAKVLVRAVDDSANYAPTPVSADYTITGPYSVLGNVTPAEIDSTDSSAVELGMRFTAAQSGSVTGVRFYKASTNTGTHTGRLWTAAGGLLGTVTFSGETASGWQTAMFATPIAVTAGQSYVVSYSAPKGHYSDADFAWSYRGDSSGPLTTAGGFGTTTSFFGSVGAFPTSSYQSTNYYVDALFQTDAAAPLTASSQWPAPGSTGVPVDTTISAAFSKPVTQSSIAFTVTDQNGASVPGSVSYNASSLTATFTPTAPLSSFVQYGVALAATASSGGGALASGGTWSFTTAKTDPTVCPCSLYPAGAVPQELQDGDPNAVTLGVRFTPGVAGTITGVRFYKGPNNTGSHIGSLWTTGGALLASGTFISETASGWQTLVFSTPVAVSAGTAYVAAYRTTVGSYSVDTGDFPLSAGPLAADSGMYSYADAYPGTVSAASYLVDVVFASGGSGTDPGDGTDPGSGTDPGDGGGTPPADGAEQTLFGDAVPDVPSAVDEPSPLEIGVSFSSAVGGVVDGVRFYKGSANTGTHVGHLWSPSGALLASVTFTGETATGWQTAKFATPVAISAGQQYVVSYFAPNGGYAHTDGFFTSDVASGPLTASASDNGLYLYTSTGGLPTYTWNATNYYVDVLFRANSTSTPSAPPTPTPTPTPSSTPTPTPTPTATPAVVETIFGTAAPANANASETRAMQLAVRFKSSVAGSVTGVRYYRATGDRVADTVTLWSSTGTKLATATVPASAPSGWQYAAFATPVSIAANTEYRASYYSSSARHALTTGGLAASTGNGLHLTAIGAANAVGTGAPTTASTSNYWADIQFIAKA